MDQKTTELRQWLWRYLEEHPDLAASGLAAYVSISRSAAEAFLSRRIEESYLKYGSKGYDEFAQLRRQIEAGDIDPTRSNSVDVLRQPATRSRSKQQLVRRPFYTTPTASRIFQVLDHCADRAIIGVISADYGVGKTSAVRQWRTTTGIETPNCYFEFDEFTRRNVRDFIKRLCEVVGADRPARGHEQMRAVIRFLCENPMLVIFDQCEVVTPAILQIIRQIWDGSSHAGTGIVLLASPLLRLRLETPRLRQEIGSLSSRVGVWLALDGVDRASAAAIIRQEGIVKIDDAAIDLLVRMSRGSMRRLMAATDLLAAKHAEKTVTAHTVEQVAEHLWGMQVDPRRRIAA